MSCNMKDAFAFLFYYLIFRKNENRAFEPMPKDAIAFSRESLYNAKNDLSTPFFKKNRKIFRFLLTNGFLRRIIQFNEQRRSF